MEGAGGRCCCFDRSKRSGGDPETAVFVGSHSPEGESGARLVLFREVETALLGSVSRSPSSGFPMQLSNHTRTY